MEAAGLPHPMRRWPFSHRSLAPQRLDPSSVGRLCIGGRIGLDSSRLRRHVRPRARRTHDARRPLARPPRVVRHGTHRLDRDRRPHPRRAAPRTLGCSSARLPARCLPEPDRCVDQSADPPHRLNPNQHRSPAQQRGVFAYTNPNSIITYLQRSFCRWRSTVTGENLVSGSAVLGSPWCWCARYRD